MRRFLQEAAWRFLLDQHITSLPVDPFRITSKNGWLVYTYEEFASLVHKSVHDLIDRYEKDGFTFWSRHDECFIICYNTALPFPVCRWTLLHEIAHIHLRHITTETPIKTRVRTEDRPLFEREAQGFARRVLCPSIVLHGCKAFEPEQIMRLCGISYDAAVYRSEYIKILEARGMFNTSPLERQVERQFAPFVSRYILHEMRRTNYDFLFEFAEWFSA